MKNPRRTLGAGLLAASLLAAFLILLLGPWKEAPDPPGSPPDLMHLYILEIPWTFELAVVTGILGALLWLIPSRRRGGGAG